ncbi:glycosyltransferase, partial [Myxococcota bacterium]|nr:glycosyltransferase [Myxococcota bacterium]
LHFAELRDSLLGLGCEVRALQLPQRETPPLPGARLLASFADPRPALRLRREARAFRADVVHVHGLRGPGALAPAAARAAGAAPFLTAHDAFAACQRVHLTRGDGRPCPGPGAGWRCGACAGPSSAAAPAFVARTAALRAAAAAFARVVAPSPAAAEALRGAGLGGARIEVVPPGVRAPAADPRAGPPRGASTPPLPRVLYLGDLRHEKGPDLLLEALRPPGAPAVRVDLRGGTGADPESAGLAYRDRLSRAARQAGATLHGPYGQADLDEILTGAAAVVVPSRIPETWGRTAAEALIRGVPVVAAAAGGLRDQVQEGVNGALFPPGDSRGLREALLRVLSGALAPAHAWPAVPTCDDAARLLLDLYVRAREDPTVPPRT